mgnify:CR=1 FL=1
MARKAEELDKCKEELAKVEGFKKQLEEQNVMLQRAKEDLAKKAQMSEDALADAEARIEEFVEQKMDMEASLKVMIEKLNYSIDNSTCTAFKINI